MAADPMPPLTARSGPPNLATVAPVPAPTLPSGIGDALEARQALRPSSGPGRTSEVIKPRSNSMADDTMGTITAPSGPALKPIPWDSR